MASQDEKRIERLVKAAAANSVRMKNAQDAKKELELEPAYHKVKTDITETRARDVKLREKITNIAHRLYKVSGIKKVHPAVTVTESSKFVVNDMEKAVQWCLDHNLAYLLTISDVEKLSQLAASDPNQDFISEESKQGVRLSSSLSKFL